MTEGDQGTDYYEIHYSLGRCEWLRTDWPALVVWVVPPLLLLALLLAATINLSGWCALALPVWFILGGAKATGLLLFLLRGSEVHLQVDEKGTIFVSENGSEPVYCHWAGVVDEGTTYLLWGADGRYRMIVPKRALTDADYSAFHSRVGIDLKALSFGQEASLRR